MTRRADRGSMRHQYRDRHLLEEAAADPAQYKLAQPRMTIGPHDDKVGGKVGSKVGGKVGSKVCQSVEVFVLCCVCMYMYKHLIIT